MLLWLKQSQSNSLLGHIKVFLISRNRREWQWLKGYILYTTKRVPRCLLAACHGPWLPCPLCSRLLSHPRCTLASSPTSIVTKQSPSPVVRNMYMSAWTAALPPQHMYCSLPKNSVIDYVKVPKQNSYTRTEEVTITQQTQLKPATDLNFPAKHNDLIKLDEKTVGW